EKVAIKILEKDKILTPGDIERVTRELRILRSLRRSPHVVQLFEIMETPREIFMVMEYASGGELFDYIVDKGRICESEACKFLRQIVCGVRHIHRNNVVHRDLKPENLLLDKDNNIRIADFGLSNFFLPGQPLRTACGSPCYAPPEMVAGLPYNPIKCDVWSVGIILYAMICGHLPFEDQNTGRLYKKILNGSFEVPSRNRTSPEVRQLIFRMLTSNPNERPSFETLLKTDPFLRGQFASPIVDPASSKLLLPPGTPADHCGVRGCRLCEYARQHSDYYTGQFDEEVLAELGTLGFPPNDVIQNLINGRKNHATTAYHLLCSKRFREGPPHLYALSSAFGIPQIPPGIVQTPANKQRVGAIARALLSPRWEARVKPIASPVMATARVNLSPPMTARTVAGHHSPHFAVFPTKVVVSQTPRVCLNPNIQGNVAAGK
ncbi:hypothetical protein FOL47_002621, partial [Perkinsus chesapeaki]